MKSLVPLNNYSEEELLAIAAALERDSTHPLALAICEEAERRGLEVPPAEEHTALPGRGAEGKIRGRTWWIGSRRLLAEKGPGGDDGNERAGELEASGQTVIAVFDEQRVCGLVGIADRPRSAAAEALRGLRKLGVKQTVMLTGDNAPTARAVAGEIGVDTIHADLLPEDKVRVVGELRARYGRTAVIGDGINDAPAMAAADIGIAMGAIGSDAAIETADIALMADDLRKVPWLVRHSRSTLSIIKQNIGFALSLKVVFLVLAGLQIATLWMAIAADMGASLLVIFNGLRLLRVRE